MKDTIPLKTLSWNSPLFSHSSHFTLVFFFSFSMPQWSGSLWYCMSE